MLKKYAYVAASALLALSITGCPAVTNALKNGVTGSTNTGLNGTTNDNTGSTNNGSTGGTTTISTAVQSAISSVLADFEGNADLSGDTSGAASFLASSKDDGSGTGLSAQSLRTLQDVAGNLGAGFSFPSTVQSTASLNLAYAGPNSNGRPYWLDLLVTNNASGLPESTYVSRNKRWTTTTTYFVNSGSPTYKPPFGEETVATDGMDGKVHSDEIVAPDATTSGLVNAVPAAPSIFLDASPSLEPAGSDLVRSTTLSFPNFGYTDGNVNTAVGYRWVIYNTSGGTPAAGTYYPIYTWARALQINRTTASGSLTVDHYDIATDYTSETIVLPSGQTKTIRAPFEFISDDYNPSARTEWHNDRTYNPNTYTWTGNGFWVNAKGATHSVSTTWNAAATSGASDVWTRTATWTNAASQSIAYVLDYNFDESGTGSISVNGTQFATLKWGTDFKGTATLASGQTLAYRVPRP